MEFIVLGSGFVMISFIVFLLPPSTSRSLSYRDFCLRPLGAIAIGTSTFDLYEPEL